MNDTAAIQQAAKPKAAHFDPDLKPVILCVDDEKIILDSLEEQIEQVLGEDFELELAESASEALEILDDLREEGRLVAVVISDQIMPGIKGDEFLIDVHEQYPETLKIMLTGQASLDAVKNAINQAGLYRYVSKPWEMNDLMMTVQTAARQFVQKIELEKFNEANKLLRNLNRASQELSRETDRQQLYLKFVSNAVGSVKADEGYLVITKGESPSVEAVAAIDPKRASELGKRFMERNPLLTEDAMKLVKAYTTETLEEHNLVLPLHNSEDELYGYVVLTNNVSKEEFDETQVEILSMLLRQLRISLEKSRLYASLAAKTNELQSEKEKVEETNSILAEKNQDIMDSINYAKRIQMAILPELNKLQKNFPESFVLYKPKDIVSGDFYWWDQRGPLFFAAAVDCTGHGVPGAFMSVISSNLLTDMVRLTDLSDPVEILEHLDNEMKLVLKQDGTNKNSTLDGMDIAMLIYNTETRQLAFGGAHNPLYLVRNGDLMEFDGSKRSIGGNTLESANNVPFEGHSVELQSGDMLYVCSDGFQDQFGGEKGRKFTRRRLREMFTEHAEAPAVKQHYQLTKTFLDWKGTHEQLDDVPVIGLRFED
ncbi:MAG: SpoIIE family protein phosphatase [Bacteroidota bacterium]